VDTASGLRERQMAATRQALHEAALRLAMDHGSDRVTNEAIADAATVSRRTFSSYVAGTRTARSASGNRSGRLGVAGGQFS
jgi:AcrR family transcriptional regulator